MMLYGFIVFIILGFVFCQQAGNGNYLSLQGQSSVETAIFRLTSDPKTRVRCFYIQKSRTTLQVEFKISASEMYERTIVDESGFVVRTVYRAIKNNNFQSLSKLATNTTEVLVLLIDTDLEPINFRKVYISADKVKEIAAEKVLLMDKVMGSIFRVNTPIGINVVTSSRGATLKYPGKQCTVNDMTYLNNMEDSKNVTLCDSVSVEKAFNLTKVVDNESNNLSDEIIIDLSKPYHINNILFRLGVSWVCKPKTTPNIEQNRYHACVPEYVPYQNQKVTVTITLKDETGKDLSKTATVIVSSTNCARRQLGATQYGYLYECSLISDRQVSYLDLIFDTNGEPTKQIKLEVERDFGQTNLLGSRQTEVFWQLHRAQLPIEISNVEAMYMPTDTWGFD